MRRRLVRLAGAALLPGLAALPGPAAAQQVEALLPDSVAHSVVAFHNRTGTTRLTGEAQIAAGTRVDGGVALLAGRLQLDGTIDGDVVVINGDLAIGPGARVSGTAVVIGGDVRVAPGAVVAGGITVYREPLRYRHTDAGIEYVPPHLERGLAAGLDLPFGRTDMLIAAHGAYNRAEGLAVAVGPRVRFSSAYPLTAEALLIVRSGVAAELDAQRFGYQIRLEQLLHHGLGLSAGVALHSLIQPIEEWGLSNREAAIAAFVLRRDYRDHFEREGWGTFLRLARPGTSTTLRLEYRDEEHGSAPPADPFTVLNRHHAWRPQPLIAEGALRSLEAVLTYDTRNEERDPSAGWLVDARIERGLGGVVEIPDTRAGGMPDPRADERSGFFTAEIDVRRYARLTPYSRLNLRVLAMGSLDARALPPQRQHALGGEGSLPGYRLFEFDCGARASVVQRGQQDFHPYYGCDRMAVVQLEYQAGFPFARRLGRRLGLGNLSNLARWTAFFDAGRAWIEPEARAGRPGGNDDFSADAGLGVRFGPLGAYWAVPLSGRGQGINFFLRVAPRI